MLVVTKHHRLTLVVLVGVTAGSPGAVSERGVLKGAVIVIVMTTIDREENKPEKTGRLDIQREITVITEKEVITFSIQNKTYLVILQFGLKYKFINI